MEKIYQKGHFLYAYDKNIMGYCAIYANDMEKQNAYITLLCVKPEFQQKHIGTILLNSSLELAMKYHMKSCVLEVKKNNISAIRFYQSNGFAFFQEKEDSFYMKRELSTY